MKIQLWGVRGSLPAPLSEVDYRNLLAGALNAAKKIWKENPLFSPEETLAEIPEEFSRLIGGETTCVSVSSKNQFLVLDMGSGARKLGYHLASQKPGDLHILMTHTHWDHIQGWPFFAPAYIPGNRIHFYSAVSNLKKRMEMQQKFEYFPVSFTQMASEKTFRKITPGKTFRIGSLKIRALSLPHPGGSVAYRIEEKGKIFIFATDGEFLGEDDFKYIEEIESFFSGADLLIMDSQYTTEEAKTKKGWGHTSNLMAVECALRWKVKKLIMTHHEPAHTNAQIFEMKKEADEYLKKMNRSEHLVVEIGFEDSFFNLE